MGIVAIVVVGVIVVMAGLLPVTLFLRSRQVDAVRLKRLRQTYDEAVADMNGGEQSWEWRFDVFQKGPSFNEMLWKMWRPVSSFYEDRRPSTEQ